MNDDPLIGRQLANFLIERVLGRGGMALVYYGQDIKLQRPVAIKVIDARYRSRPGYAERFVKEARSVAKWRHEHIIQIYYANDDDGLYYYVMEYIDGQDLATVMSAYTTEGELMPSDEILRIGRAIASALDYAHHKGVIHRDVKPSNVLMSEDGRVVLGDFGLALDMQEGSSGEVFGTPHYISPEQARRSKDVVPQSDLYALGVILYEMLTGVVPFDDLSPTSVALQHITQPPPPPRSINPQLNLETEQVLLKALNKAPQERYQSGAELMDALEKALADLDPAQEQKVLALPPMPAAILSGQAPTVFHSQVESLDATQLHAPAPLSSPHFELQNGGNEGGVLAASVAPAQQGKSEAGFPRRGAGLRRERSAERAVWPVVALLGLVVFLLIGGSLFFDPAAFQAATSFFAAQTAPGQPTPIANAKTPAILPPTVTATSSPSPTATSPLQTATSTLTRLAVAESTGTSALPTGDLRLSATPTPTELGQAEGMTPTATGTATAAPLAPSHTPSSTAVPTPTVKYPNGKRFLLFYDEHGLYLMNVSDENRSLALITFERLDDAGLPHNRFDGWRWAQFYPTLYSNNCIKIEIPNSPEYAARPVQCENRYVGSRFYSRDSEFIFWIRQANSYQFRVLWQDEELARCEIEKGACEVFVP